MDEESDFFRSLILSADAAEERDYVDDDEDISQDLEVDDTVPLPQSASSISTQAQPTPPAKAPSQQKFDQGSNADNTGSSSNKRKPSPTLPPPCLRKGRRFKDFEAIIECVRKWHREAFPSRRCPITRKGEIRQDGTYRPYVMCTEYESDGVQCDFMLSFSPVKGSSDYLVEKVSKTIFLNRAIFPSNTVCSCMSF
jgi:hypothetical protein